MSVLPNGELATAISDMDCSNCENVNATTLSTMPATEAIFIAPIGSGGNGIDTDAEDDVADTLEQISEINARLVIGLITTDYLMISQNGYPG